MNSVVDFGLPQQQIRLHRSHLRHRTLELVDSLGVFSQQRQDLPQLLFLRDGGHLSSGEVLMRCQSHEFPHKSIRVLGNYREIAGGSSSLPSKDLNRTQSVCDFDRWDAEIRRTKDREAI